MKSLLQIFLVTFFLVVVSSAVNKKNEHTLVKRQSQPFPPRSPQRPFPLSRSRQFPPPEELEELSPEDSTDEEEEPAPAAVNPPVRRPASRFRGRQPAAPPEADDDVNNTPAPQTTTPAPEKSTPAPGRVSRFGVNRPRLQINSQSQAPKPTPDTTTSTKPAPSVSSSGTSNSRSRSRLSPRADVGSDSLSRSSPPRTQTRTSASSVVADEKPSTNADTPIRRTGTGRVRARGRLRTRTSSTTTTTTTTTTKAPPSDDYYYYYYEDEEEGLPKQPIATTTTTTTTTTRPPSLPRRPVPGRRPGNARPSGFRSSTSTPRAAVKFDPESQFQPPPEDAEEAALPTERSTRKFTTSTTAAPGPGGIPAHLAHKYKPRKDGRFIDYLRDPNRPRELKGFDLTDYPFYIKVPEDLTFDCEDKKDGYYASVPHHCQLFHYCFAGARYDFLCANYTLYDQTTFTCRFANNVDCESSESYYYRNDDLWKETTTTSTTTAAPEVKKKRKKDYEDDYEDEEEYDYDEEDEEDERPKRRRNRRRKNRRKSS